MEGTRNEQFLRFEKTKIRADKKLKKKNNTKEK
jgi:hypothetical protein